VPTYVYGQTSGGAGTSTDQLSGTAVRKAGPKGIVRAGLASTLTTSTWLLKGRQTGIEVVPNGSRSNVVGAITQQSIGVQEMVFAAQVQPGEDLELTLVRIGTETVMAVIQTE
jgi:hypothetical protein